MSGDWAQRMLDDMEECFSFYLEMSLLYPPLYDHPVYMSPRDEYKMNEHYRRLAIYNARELANAEANEARRIKNRRKAERRIRR